jgi:ribonuclease HII
MKLIIGIDEVGRGALAGPVVVGAMALAAGKRTIFPGELGQLKDSKKLSPRQRELWAKHFKLRQDVFFATGRAYPRGIERMNISRAANLAAERAFSALLKANKLSARDIRTVFLDGGLYLGNGDRPANAKTIIKGDEKVRVVAMASIIAKVQRDAYMVRLGKRYPQYGFAIHKGYGTRLHRAALKKHGPSPVHRKTFLH